MAPHGPSALAGAVLVTALALLPAGLRAQQVESAAGEELTWSTPAAGPDRGIPLPDPTGPFLVGTRTFHWVLASPEELTPSPSDRREVVAQLLYPARRPPNGGPAAYVPELDLLRRGLRVHGFPPFAELAARMGRYARVRTAAWPGAPVLAADGPFPVVVISPGGNMSRHWHTALAQELASLGYAVALVSHAHSGMDVFPGGGFLASHLRWHPGEEVPDEEVARRDRELADRLADDVSAVLRGLGELNRRAEPRGVGGALDLERLAILGHSRGGSTVTRTCGADPRFDACVIFDNLGAVEGVDPAFHQPRLTVRAAWPEERSRSLSEILAASGPVAFEAVLPGATHFTFTDLPLVDPEGYPPAELGPEEGHRLVAGLTRAFLDRYLRERGPPFLEAAARLDGAIEMREH